MLQGVDIKVQVCFVTVLNRQRFETYIFLIDLHKNCNIKLKEEKRKNKIFSYEIIKNFSVYSQHQWFILSH